MQYLGLNSRDALYNLQKLKDFPAPIKMGNERQGAIYFITQELDDWIEKQKFKRPSTPQVFNSVTEHLGG